MTDALIFATFVTLAVTPVVWAAVWLLRRLGGVKPPAVPVPEIVTLAAPEGVGDPAVVHEVPLDVAEFHIPNFRPGIDRVQVALQDPDVKVRNCRIAGGVAAHFRDGSDVLTLGFLGLDAVPHSDIDLRIGGQISGTLADETGMASADVPDESDLDAIWQVAAWSEADDESEIALAAGHAEGGSGLVEFLGFNPEGEVVEIWVDAEDLSETCVDVVPTADGRDALVSVDGRTTALLRGAPEARPENVRLVSKAQRAAA